MHPRWVLSQRGFFERFKEYGDLLGRLRVAVPKMVLQVGGSPTE